MGTERRKNKNLFDKIFNDVKQLTLFKELIADC